VEADLYIAHYVAALPAVSKAAAKHKASYAFDGEDFHPGELVPGPSSKIDRLLIDKILSSYLPGSSGMTAASPLIAEAYFKSFGVKYPDVILNVFPKPNLFGPTLAGSTVPGPSVYWISQTIGEGRGLEEAIEACGLSSAIPHLYLRGAVSDEYRHTLQRLALRCGMEKRLHFLPLLPPDQLEIAASAFDVGVCTETGETFNHDIALANKLFSYLVAGVPAIISDTTAHQQIALELGIACHVYRRGDTISFASKLDFLLNNPVSLAQARKAAHSLGHERFNWEAEKHRLLAAVSRFLQDK
jgi:glycosyltransferase involved in cell wall biosynthesis